MPKRRRRKGARKPAGTAGATNNIIHDTDPPLTPAVAATLLNLRLRRLLHLAHINAIPSYRIDGRLCFRLAELLGWADAGFPTYPNAADRVRQGVAR